MAYMSFQGIPYIGQRDANGQPVSLRAPGNVAKMTINLERVTLKHHETKTGARAVDLVLTRERNVSFTLTLEDFSPDNLALALYGQPITVPAGSVTGEQVGPSAPIIGARYTLQHMKVSNLVITDSAGNTLTRDQHYLASDEHGGVTFLDLTGLTAPFLASYTYAERSDVGIFTTPAPERWIRFEGVNTANNDAPVVVELYRAVFEPAGSIDMINNELGVFDLSGDLLIDPTKTPTAPLGQFGNIKGA